MEQSRVSIIVVSQGRPKLLNRCLLGISQLFYENFEVIVVSDDTGLKTAASVNLTIKTVNFTQQNISIARNLGIEQAAGEIIAFIDDDAVPEPSWLDHLSAPFFDPSVHATGGFVRGRNGVHFQWTSQWVDQTGRCHPLEMPDFLPKTFVSHEGRAIKTEGTNCAFRAITLRKLGGFDPAFSFFLDETDVNMRFAQQNLATTLVPKAQVWHGYAASPRRNANRAPLDLTQIGRSSAVFARKHNKEQTLEAAYKDARQEQHNRLINHMINGTIEPSHVKDLLKGFDSGWQDGRSMECNPCNPITSHAPEFIQATTRPRPTSGVYVIVDLSKKPQAAKYIQQARQQNKIVTSMKTKRLFAPPRERFSNEGIWEKTCGLMRQFDKSLLKRPNSTAFSQRLSIKNSLNLRNTV